MVSDLPFKKNSTQLLMGSYGIVLIVGKRFGIKVMCASKCGSSRQSVALPKTLALIHLQPG